MLAEFKARLESLQSEEQQCRSREIEFEQQLRADEARLSDYHNQLDRLDKVLDNVGRRTDGSSQ
jgi:archaellum component FlaC